MHPRKKLPGIRLGQSDPSAKVVAYADDVMIFVTSTADIPIIQETLRSYEEASGARVNTRKSKVARLRSLGHLPTDNGHPILQ